MGKKNRDETIKKLIAAVGEILKEQGYMGLGVNKIAVSAGVSKELIYRYFGSLNNLLKVYIGSRDYWQPVLQNLNKGSPEDTLAMFTDLLQNQFRFFYEEKEMQVHPLADQRV